MTALRLYNTLTRTKDDFVPIDPNNVRMYVCGPTVYDFAHIGNARPAIVFDVLFRLLRHIYGPDQVTYVRNITDIDDKINARAAERGISIRELTDQTYEQYNNDVAALGCLSPSEQPRATDNIDVMKDIIEKLIENQNAYIANEHVLFFVPSMPDYGQLSKRPLDEMVAGARVDVAPFKRNPMDFVLWKPSDQRSNVPLPGWKSPHGIEIPGRPGWHIECSAMSWAKLGETFDIHGGGLDLIFPHHENEIAQSRCAFHTGFMAKYWMHNGFLQVEGDKMSKSLGNFVTINELLRDFPGGALRFAMMQTHYRSPTNWTKIKAEEAWSELRDWAAAIYGSHAEHDLNLRIAQRKAPIPHPSVLEALNDDLNTSDAITAMRDLYKRSSDPEIYSQLIETAEFLGLFKAGKIGAYARGVSGINLGPDRTFELYESAESLRIAILNDQLRARIDLEKEISDRGIGVDISYDGFVKFQPLNTESPFEGGTIQRLITARNAARARKDFKESDRIRDELLAQGIVLKDTPQGTTWEVKR